MLSKINLYQNFCYNPLVHNLVSNYVKGVQN